MTSECFQAKLSKMAKSPLPSAHYDLTDLRVFIAVAEEGSVSRGAQRCHLAASTVSLRIKGLEEAIGTALLQRQSRGVGLSPAGHVMLDHARRCVAQLEQMHADLMPFAQGISGHITLFANNNAISTHLPDDLARYLADHPSVRITLTERLSTDIVSAVVQGSADVGVVAVESPHPDLLYLPYRVDHLVVLAPKGSSIAKRRRTAFSDCLQAPFISLQQGAALHTFLMNKASSLGARLDVRVQVSGYRAIARLVDAGVGIGVVPKTALEAADRDRVAVVELTDNWARRDLRVCVRSGTCGANPHLQDLVRLLTHKGEISTSGGFRFSMELQRNAP